MTLRESDFVPFFEGIHGHPPLQWQQRLLNEVLQAGWGAPIDLPTASGKTAVLDIAVFALALQAGHVDRRTPRRVALVVDRRIVVDDAYRRACRIRDALTTLITAQGQPSHVLGVVRDRLLLLGGEHPLDCAALRGGIYREDRWARTPLQPVLLCSTVDQIGSRLLHRGYGLSPFAWPLHAGLLGNDTLIILDEAHCSRPFLETLAAVERFRRVGVAPVSTPWAFVPMTATPPPSERAAFRLTEGERTEPVLAQRIGATKRAVLRVADSKGDKGLAASIVSEIAQPESPWVGMGRTTLVVVNRVLAARLIFDELRRRAAGTHGKLGSWSGGVLLLTGRSRPLERSAILAKHSRRLIAGRDRSEVASEAPLVVVATQCIEVGADLDVDCLITEACPLDSLRQRFGRLDRLGRLGNARSMIVCRPEYAEDPAKDVDPVYGDRLAKTWQWLLGEAVSGEVDFGIAALDRLNPPAAQLAAPSTSAPLMFPAYCDLWVQTSPLPSVSPEPSIFLHGPRSGPADVGFVWRADLDPDAPDSWADTVAVCPPAAGEVLPVPLHLARAWMAGANVDPGSDVEGDSTTDELPEVTGGVNPALRWTGPEDSDVIVDPGLIQPGDVLVMPCQTGGADAFGWSGDPSDRPADLALAARAEARRAPLLRVHPALTTAYWGDQVPTGWASLSEQVVSGDGEARTQLDLTEIVLASLPSWLHEATEPTLTQTLAGLVADGKAVRVHLHPTGQGIVISGQRRLGHDAADFSDEDDMSSLSPKGLVTLEVHLADVREWARRIAKSAQLPEALVDAVGLAGYLHDLGKVDPRFQAWLVGGDPMKVDRQSPLAKSDRIRIGVASRQARRRAGYPEGSRHELLSVRMAESATALLPKDPILRDLVLHLVASHHGRCRPWAPIARDERPITVRHRFSGQDMQATTATGLEALDSGVAERFWRLVRHFGWWGLPYLEACLRLADHRASERPGLGSSEVSA